MTKTKLFAISASLTTCVTLVVFYVQRSPPRPVPVPLGEGDSAYLSSQIRLQDIAYLRRRGMNTIVDMRPDGEAPDEPTHMHDPHFIASRTASFT